MKKRFPLFLCAVSVVLLAPPATLPEKEILVQGHFYIEDQWVEFSGTVEADSPKDALAGGLVLVRAFAEGLDWHNTPRARSYLPGGRRVAPSSSDSRASVAKIKEPVPIETSAYGPRSYGALPIFGFR